ncbi:membrane-bound lytic murein transglycosylase MltF [Motilimonas eburnea]|uniref:membrane-bound lytic murein transglycosylase MltF n=1 Tax=Motilimonas eburnea TaxID=1737488 RepID=UPI001E57D28A|nr:membrane-bound lytic murein transglycosylase MltF [Motilimonas eburnea]MCE2571582.1 membrane-bound lytic murein transglycosylase MltF [Motilimonas eburnea]
MKHPFIYPLLIVVFGLMLSACEPLQDFSQLQQIQQRGVLRVGTLNTPVSYAYDGDTLSGMDYELASDLATYLGVRLDMSPAYSLTELFKELDQGNIDFIAAGLTLTPERAQKYRSAPPLYNVARTLVYRKGNTQPKDFSEINDPIVVLKDSGPEELLRRKQIQYPTLEWVAIDDEDPVEILRMVANEEAIYAMVDDKVLARAQRYYPTLTEGFTLENDLPVAWMLKKSIDDSLYSVLIEFIGQHQQSGHITKLVERYFGHIEKFDFVDTRSFLKRAETTLPQYQPLFEKYQTDQFDWVMLAAISYQESHWQPDARSPTGVRGMMMLTNDTAKFIGVDNRLDPEQSIRGGAQYLTYLLGLIPDSVHQDEKIWFALAAYNLGFGHLMDARRLTRSIGKDQDSWKDVKDVLPLLQRKQWHQRTRYGYARGGEARHYVHNIRQYQESLAWLVREQAKQALLDIEAQANDAVSGAMATENNADEMPASSEPIETTDETVEVTPDAPLESPQNAELDKDENE